MTRMCIAAALSMLLLTSCSNTPTYIHTAADPARDVACPTAFPKLGELKPLGSVTLSAPATATAEDGTTMVLPAGTDLVQLDHVLDRDETTAVALIDGKAAWQGCRAVVDYRVEFDRQMADAKGGK